MAVLPLPPKARPANKVSIIGAGRVGGVFSTALAFSVHDIEVVVLDKDPSTVTAWNSGTAPFEEPDLDAMLKVCFTNPQRSLAFTTDTTAAIKGAHTHFICVDTPPLQPTELMNDLAISDVVDALAMIENDASVSGSIVLRSTMPLGATEHLTRGLHERNEHRNLKLDLILNPEFFAGGSAVKNTIAPDRIVIGSDMTTRGSAKAQQLEDMYKRWLPITSIMVVDFATAELAKLASNFMLAQRISNMSALSAVAEMAGADMSRVAEIARLDTRIGQASVNVSPGFGGGCLTKDIGALAFAAKHSTLSDVDADYFASVVTVNKDHISRISKRILEAFRVESTSTATSSGNKIAADSPVPAPIPTPAKKVAIIGFSYKPGVLDIRNTPSADVAAALLEQGFLVSIYDPCLHDVAILTPFTDTPEEQRARLSVELTPKDALQDTGAMVVMSDRVLKLDTVSDWEEVYYPIMQRPRYVLDCWDCFDHVGMEKLGFRVQCLGKGL